MFLVDNFRTFILIGGLICSFGITPSSAATTCAGGATCTDPGDFCAVKLEDGTAETACVAAADVATKCQSATPGDDIKDCVATPDTITHCCCSKDSCNDLMKMETKQTICMDPILAAKDSCKDMPTMGPGMTGMSTDMPVEGSTDGEPGEPGENGGTTVVSLSKGTIITLLSLGAYYSQAASA